ncbi:MAG TPA: 4Fe-4S ferredoxin [Nitrospiraceae bacterium]|jgi:carbon-monoxide dehydrogenase iron sulfur subunit|nr:4Fe-4S ferredoxin [Nitrospiraceae bacterium]
MKQIYVRPERCMGCRSCEIGCAVQHSKEKTLFSAVIQSPSPMKRLFVESTDNLRMPIICRHCEDAPCLRACISGCLYRDEKEFVRRRKERCIGCWTCMMACPFGVITRDKEKHIAVKCDRCHKLDVPACVNACPTGALVLVDVDDMPREKRQRLIFDEAKGGV